MKSESLKKAADDIYYFSKKAWVDRYAICIELRFAFYDLNQKWS